MNKVRYFVIQILVLLYALCHISCDNEPYTQGKRIYEVNCANCHMDNGKGLGEMYPDITGSKYLNEQKAELPCLIRYGKNGGVLANVVMPANKELTEAGMNNLINYLLNTWGDGTVSNVNDLKVNLQNCKKDESTKM